MNTSPGRRPGSAPRRIDDASGQRLFPLHRAGVVAGDLHDHRIVAAGNTGIACVVIELVRIVRAESDEAVVLGHAEGFRHGPIDAFAQRSEGLRLRFARAMRTGGMAVSQRWERRHARLAA